MSPSNQFPRLLFIALVCILLTAVPHPGPAHAAGTCAILPGQVRINEIVPSASGGVDWVELYNTTNTALSLDNCYIDDIPAGGSAPFQVAVGNTIPAHGFWTLDKGSYFNNTGDDVRLLAEDAVTVLDSYTYPTTDADRSWYRSPDGGLWALGENPSPSKGSTNDNRGVCLTGSWTPGNLEIHHINLGQADAALIVSPTGKSLLFDAGEDSWNSSANALLMGAYIQNVLGCKQLDTVVISHFHADHIGYVGYGGLWHLVEAQNFSVGQTLLRNYVSYIGDGSGTLTNWKTYLTGNGAAKLHPATAVEGTSQVNLGGGVSFKIVTTDGNGALLPGDFSSNDTPPSENDYSIGAVLRYGAFDEWLGGDLDGEFSSSGFGYSYHDIELSVAPEVGDVDVYRVNHHGSDHSSSPTFVGQLDPEVSIISVGNNTYGHPRQSVVDALLATSNIYMTGRGDLATNIGSAVVAGNVVIKTSNGTNYTVNGTPYIATDPIRSDVDGDGYFAEVDPADGNPGLKPGPRGGCHALYQSCVLATATVTVTRTLTRTPTRTVTPTQTLTPTVTKTPVTVRVLSIAAQDGWVLESAENSNLGSALNSTATTFNLGDDAAKRQYRSILSFNTGTSLPDNAVISGVMLKVRQQAIVGGGNPLTMFQGFMVDIKNGFFGTAALQASDFQSAASKMYGPFNGALVGGWYSMNLTTGKGYINQVAANNGLTQIRLRFKLDDNNNAVANILSLYSGNASAANRPQLVITYTTIP